jgi:hypothetical protein
MQPFAVQSEAVTMDVGSGHFAFSSFTFHKAKTRKREIISFPVFAFTFTRNGHSRQLYIGIQREDKQKIV